jgi:hypothetical protein
MFRTLSCHPIISKKSGLSRGWLRRKEFYGRFSIEIIANHTIHFTKETQNPMFAMIAPSMKEAIIKSSDNFLKIKRYIMGHTHKNNPPKNNHSEYCISVIL